MAEQDREVAAAEPIENAPLVGEKRGHDLEPGGLSIERQPPEARQVPRSDLNRSTRPCQIDASESLFGPHEIGIGSARPSPGRAERVIARGP